MAMTTWRRPMSPEDDYQALQKLKTWFAEHPGCTVPQEGITALGLPDMTGIPAIRALRTSTQRRMAREAEAMLHHARYVISMRDHPLPRRNPSASCGAA
jgi:hypothetical protein